MSEEDLGRLAEAQAAWWLRLRGYRVLARRFRTPVGEIDLVTRRGRVLAFVEVKARPDLETALHALTPHQRRRIARAALWWLQRHPDHRDLDRRFDLVAIRPRRLPMHLTGAWRADDDGPSPETA